MRYDSITDVIGDTPLVRIDRGVHQLENFELYAKLEMLNPFGSVKDRAAWAMLQPSLVQPTGPTGMAGPAGSVIELSSGNTAKALAVLAGIHGLRFKSITNRMKVPEIKELLLLLGAEIEELAGQTECLDPTNSDDPLTRIHTELAHSGDGVVHTDQYFNQLNPAAHESGTGPEILKDLDGQAPNVFIACVGTAGSSTGVARVLRAHDSGVEVVGLVGEKSDFIPGIRNIDEVHEVGLFDPATYDSIASVGTEEAIDGMLTLIRRCGILSGPTGGAAYAGAVRHLRSIDRKLQQPAIAVFIVCDRVESYLSYIKKRRPELLKQPPRRNSVAALDPADLAAVQTVQVDAAPEWIESSAALVVDLRGPSAYAALHIPGSINIVDELFDELVSGGLPFPRSRPVLLACPVGEKSERYAALLTKMGHPEVRSLAGGIIAWRDAGAPLVSV